MNEILNVLTQNIAPIFLIAALGFWLRRRLEVDPRPVASVVFNGFSPALVFTSLVNSQLAGEEVARLSLFTFLIVVAMGIVGLLAARALRLSKVDTAVLLLTVMFVNSGNYGLTLNRLRYGDAGLSRAVVFYTVSTVFVYTVGVLIVSMGHLDWASALRGLVRIPAIYAVFLAIVVYATGVVVPGPLMRAVEVAAEGAIPAMIVVLGMNFADMHELSALKLTLPPVTLRLLLGPLIAAGVAAFIGLSGLSRSAAIIEASMPTAVLTTVLATEFDVRPPLVTSIVVLSTLLSPITLALYITAFSL